MEDEKSSYTIEWFAKLIAIIAVISAFFWGFIPKRHDYVYELR